MYNIQFILKILVGFEKQLLKHLIQLNEQNTQKINQIKAIITLLLICRESTDSVVSHFIHYLCNICSNIYFFFLSTYYERVL